MFGFINEYMTKKLIICFVFLWTSLCFPQQFSVEGQIVDSKNQPIAFANVILTDRENPEILKGTTSNDDGNFQINNIAMVKLRSSNLHP